MITPSLKPIQLKQTYMQTRTLWRSIEVDSTWRPVKDYTRDHIKPNDRDKYYFDSYDPTDLKQILETKHNKQ